MAQSPEKTDSCLVSPAVASTTGVASETRESTCSRTSSSRPPSITKTSCATEGALSNAIRDHATSGRPQRPTNCLPSGLPKRVPEPPATMIAQLSATPAC